MKRTLFVLGSLILAATMLLTACGTAATPTTSGPITLTIWDGYHAGGSEEATITKLVNDYQTANPNVQVTLLEVPFDQLYNKYETTVASGSTTPDMYTAPNDNLGSEVRMGVLADITTLVTGKLTGYTTAGVNGVTVDSKIYAVPGIAKAVGLFYNKSTIPNPPKTTDDLMTLVKAGKKVGFVNNGAYYIWGFWSAFGGTLLDSTGKCVADQTTGFADALQYLADLQTAGATIDSDEGKLDTAFKQGQLDMLIEGPWELGDFETALGTNLGVVAGPTGPKGAFMPMMGIDGWYINPNSQNKAAALDLAFYIFGQNGLTAYENTAGDPAARADVTPTDPLVKAFADIAAGGDPRMQTVEFGNYWGPFGDAMTAVFSGKSTATAAVATACATMNTANKK